MSAAEEGPRVPPGPRPLETVASGDHVCLLHESEADGLEAMRAFVGGGLERGQKCLCATSPKTRSALQEQLRQDAREPGVDLPSGRLEFIDPEELLGCPSASAPEQFRRALEELARGASDGLKAVLDLTPVAADGADIPTILAFEAAVEKFVRESRAACMCCYRRAEVAGEVLLEAVCAHRWVASGQSIGRNPLFVPAEESPSEAAAERKLARLLELCREGGRFGADQHELAAVLESVRDVAYRLDLREGAFTYVSPSVEELVGMSPVELVGKSAREVYEHIHPDDRDKFEEHTARLLADPQVGPDTGIIEYRIRPPDGGETWVSNNRRLIRTPDGEPLAIVGSVRDVTDQRREREKLREQHRAFSALLSNVPGVAYRCCNDGEWSIEFLSEGWRDLTGRSREEMMGEGMDSYIELIHPEDRESVEEQVSSALQERAPFELEHRMSTAEGAQVWVRNQGRGVFSAEGELLALEGFITDVTERKEARESVREVERERTTIMNSIMEHVIYQDPEGRILWVNRAAARSLGKNPEELVGKYCYKLWQGREERCAGCPVERALEAGSPLRGEVSTPDGRIWQVGGCPVRDQEGRIVGAVEVTLEVTDRKRAEQQLRASEKRYRDLWDNAPVAYHMVDTEGTILRVNRTEQEMLGYTASEMVGRPIFDFVAPEQRDEAKDRFRRKLAGETVPKAEDREYVTKDGRRIPVSIDDVLERDDEGRVTSIRSTMVDVTEQMRLREELRALSLEDELTGLMNRRGFSHLGNQQMKVARRTGSDLFLLFADVDRMKWINDHFGHPEGDRALMEVGAVLAETFRDADIVGRVGGDEFAVLALATLEDSAEAIQNRLQTELKERSLQRGRPYELSLSVGFATYDPEKPVCLDELLSLADARMYEEKRRKAEDLRAGHGRRP